MIVNPRAGRGRALRRLPALVAGLADLGIIAEIVVTRAPGAATGVAARFAARELPLVLAVGGDGTVNEVANGLLGASATRLAVIPAGRGRDLCRGLATSRGPRSLATLLSAPGRVIDLGQAVFADGGERVFVNVAGVGFDAVVSRGANVSRWPGNHLPYLASVAGALAGWHNPEMTVRIDNQPATTGHCRTVVVANGPFFGGGFHIVPGARPDDGRLDVAVIGDITHRELVRMVPALYRGAHTAHPLYSHRPAASVAVASKPAMPVQLDGEVSGATPVTFTVVPAALRVVV